MESTSTSSGIQAPYWDTDDRHLTQLTRPGSDTQMQLSPANGIPKPAGGIQSVVSAQEGWWIAFLRFTWIMSLLQSIFGERKEGNSERPTSPRAETSPTNNVSYGNHNTNVGNTNNSHNNTTTFNGPVGAYGDQAKNKWISPQFHMGPQPHPQT